MNKRCRRVLLPLLALLLVACAGQPLPPAPAPVSAPATPERTLRHVDLVADTVWEGRVVIDGTVRVAAGTTLTIRPGTEVSFRRRDDDGDGLGDGTLIVEGALHAEGTRARPIRFHSAAADPRAGDWLEIRAEPSADLRLRWCEIRDAACALRALGSRGSVIDSRLRRNIDGSYLEEADILFRNCLIEENEGNGIAFRNAPVTIVRTIVRYNAAGVFLLVSDRPFTLRDNNIHGNGDNFRLGEPAAGEVRLAGNWWGRAERREAEESVHDRRRDPRLPLVRLDPAPAWIGGTGPRDRLALREAWRFETGGFVDAGPAAGDDLVYVPSWDGRLYAFDAAGNLRWQRDLGNVVDAAPLLDRGALFLQSWEREVRALDRHTGKEVWRFTYSPSAADDNRQGRVVRSGALLLVPAWNGHLYALDVVTGARLWQVYAGLPLRAAPATDGEHIYQGSGAGVLSAWTSDGFPLWQRDLGAPLLATPALTPEGPVAVTRDGLLVAFDRAGNERWRRALGEECHYGAPLYDSRALYLGTAAGTLWKLEATTGRTLWRHAASGPLYAQPLLADGRLFVGDNSARLSVIGADSGELLAAFRVEGEIQGTPARLGNRIVFGSRDHRVYGLEVVEEATEE